MKTEPLYIVVGLTGEYADKMEWPVIAFTSETKALEYAEKTNQWCRDNGFARDTMKNSSDFHNPYDPQLYSQYNGVEYCVVESQLAI